MMSFLECKICNIPYDEEERRPRTATCGHEWCSACISKLIEGSVFLCPKCRQKSKVDACDDLPVTFGLIDVLRVFKNQYISLPQKIEPIASEALNVDVCKVHQKTIGHRCLKCQRWLCDVCVCSHTKLTGCSTINSSSAIKSMSEDQTKSIDVLLSNFEKGSNNLLSQIQVHSDKIKVNTQKIKKLKQQSEEHENEIKKIQHLLEQGKQQTEDILKSKKDLGAKNSPYAFMDGIEVLEEMKQTLRSWSMKNLGKNFSHHNDPYDISKALEEHWDICIETVIKDQNKCGKLSQHGNKRYFHTFREQTETHDAIFMPLGYLQKFMPFSPSLVFMELSLDGHVLGLVHVRLDKNLPNIREHMVQLVTGQQGHTLAGIKLDADGDDSLSNENSPIHEMFFTPDSNVRSNSKKGDLVAYYGSGDLGIQQIYFQIAPGDDKDFKVIGFIESGMSIIQDCHDNCSKGVVITDCGIVLEHK